MGCFGGEVTYRLTDRQKAVLRLVADGEPSKHVAKRLGISQLTVYSHYKAILIATSSRNRTEAAVKAVRAGLL